MLPVDSRCCFLLGLHVCLFLDALLPDSGETHSETVHKMFDEIKRCLAYGGRYLIISLVQEIVLKVWANYFSDKLVYFRLFS